MKLLFEGLKCLRTGLLFVPIACAYFSVSILLLVASPLLYGIYYFKGEQSFYKVRSVVSRKKMPVLRPIPTATASQGGWLNKLLAYMFMPRRWQLMQNWHWFYTENKGKQNARQVELVVPKGFICDAASIPRPFRALLNPTGALLLPAMLHDYAYKYNQLWQCDPNSGFTSYFPEPDFNNMESGAQMAAWDRFLFQAGQQINGLWPVNATIRYLGWIGLTECTWRQYRKLNKPVLTPVKPAAGNKCICRFNP